MNIPTAEEFLKNKKYPSYTENGGLGIGFVHKLMIEFAKMHVEAALKEASENVKYREQLTMQGVQRTFSLNSILNAYPLKNIK